VEVEGWEDKLQGAVVITMRQNQENQGCQKGREEGEGEETVQVAGITVGVGLVVVEEVKKVWKVEGPSGAGVPTATATLML
jgi:hypothetical protein